MIDKNSAIAATLSLTHRLLSIDMLPGLPTPLVNGYPPDDIYRDPVKVVTEKKITLTKKHQLFCALVKVVKVVKVIFHLSHMRARARACVYRSLFCYLFFIIIKSALTTLTNTVFTGLFALTITLTIW
jgi:hypothetical protein